MSNAEESLPGSALPKSCNVPRADRKILLLKVLDQKGFERCIVGGHVWIMKNDKIYTEVALGGELYEVKMNTIPLQESVLAMVKRLIVRATLACTVDLT